MPTLLFTRENAAEMARRSNEAKRLTKEREAIAKAFPPLDPLDNGQVRRIAKQIEAIELLMAKETDGKELSNLTSAHARLFEAWRILTNTPKPSPSRSKRRERPADLQPLQNQAPSVELPTPQKPLGWEYDG